MQSQIVLKFEGPAEVPQRRFALLHTAFLLGADAPRPIDVMRQELVLLEKLEAISEPDDSTDGKVGALGPRARVVKIGSVITLTPHEHEMLTSSVKKMNWTRSAVRGVVDVIDWLEDARPAAEAPR